MPPATRGTSSGSRSSAVERLTCISSPLVWAERSQRCSWVQARAWTSSPIGTISPERSASGMNSDGEMSSAPSRCQRASASAPTTRPVASSTIGW